MGSGNWMFRLIDVGTLDECELSLCCHERERTMSRTGKHHSRNRRQASGGGRQASHEARERAREKHGPGVEA
jgi:hypothetical protein